MQQNRFKTLWISDIHLGCKDCKAQFLLDFLHSTECETLYIVGDLIDFWSLRRGGRWLDSHSRVLQTIVAKSLNGTRVRYIPGNHDEALRDYVGLRVAGVDILQDTVHKTADGRHFLVTHGDEFEALVRCGGAIKHWFGSWSYDLLLAVNRWINFTRRRFNYPYWSLANFLKSHIGQAASYIERFESAAAHEAKRRGLDGVICGHIHKAEILSIHDVVYCNDGDWVESCTGMVEHHDGTLQILYWADEKVVMLQRDTKQPLPGLAKTG
jgi:UDP-2,3-diacylglucosamine pyrophosphatase LpxH